MEKKRITELQRVNVETYKTLPKINLTVVLDNIRSLHNVGSVFRTSDAFRVSKIYLCGITATPPHPEIHKTALGAEDSVAWEYVEDTLTAIEQLKREGNYIYAVEQVKGSISMENLRLDPARSYAVVLGNEVKGVQQSVVDAADAALEIPQFGTKHSLNISVTAGMVIWDCFKQLGL